MKIFILNTELFPEKGILEEALAQLGAEHEISRHDVDVDHPDADWDRAVQALVFADRIVTL